ncbi:hypothetical protein ACH5RR_001798 [Cinchona calisaya]|uniref:G domain-containing protein n=1 Tax=Cinchona calisaya TaxID=153742 RepID=A0ABD3B4F1_9GENT
MRSLGQDGWKIAAALMGRHIGGEKFDVDADVISGVNELKVNKLPTIVIMGCPNVGKSALFNRLIRRREALVDNIPTDHVTPDIGEGIAKFGDLRFNVLDSAGLEAKASSGSLPSVTA